MKKAATNKKKEKDGEEEGFSMTSKIASFLNNNKNCHYNDFDIDEYYVSTGSLNFDRAIEGGFSSGIVRFCGATEAGKSSEALDVVTNFQKIHGEDSMALFIKAEGRLSKSMRERSSLSFTTDVQEWDSKNVFVFKCNVFETIVEFLETFLGVCEKAEKKLVVVLDSLDGLVRKSDLTKSIEDQQVAGVPLLLDRFLRRFSLRVGEMGHLLILVSQVRAKIDINKYSSNPQKSLSGSGGNSVAHYPDWIITFLKRNKSDNILEFPDAMPDLKKNRIIGHNVTVAIEKSTNDTTGYRVTYPVKHGVSSGSAIWVEKEVVENMILDGYIIKAGSWFSFSKEAESLCPLLPKNFKIQGMSGIHQLFNDNKDIMSFWYEKLTGKKNVVV